MRRTIAARWDRSSAAQFVVVVYRISFDGLDCGKFALTMWFATQGTRIKLTNLPNHCAASRARDGEYLGQREF
jgi:hypothetical protein